MRYAKIERVERVCESVESREVGPQTQKREELVGSKWESIVEKIQRR
jgi:hypothetical protein